MPLETMIVSDIETSLLVYMNLLASIVVFGTIVHVIPTTVVYYTCDITEMWNMFVILILHALMLQYCPTLVCRKLFKNRAYSKWTNVHTFLCISILYCPIACA